MINIEEFKSYLSIDEAHLDKELIQQASLFFSVGEAYTEAVSLRDQLKDRISRIDAELYRTFRTKHEKKGEKVTEAWLNSEIQTSNKHQKIFKKYIEAKKLSDTLEQLKDAFRMRSYVLRELASLYITHIHERSSVMGIQSEGKEVRSKQAKDKMTKERKKRVRT